MLTGLRARAILLSVVPLAFLLLLLLLTIVLERETQEAGRWAEHSAQVLSSSDRLQQTLAAANSAAIEYSVRRRADYAVGFNAAVRSLKIQLRDLERQTADNSSQEARARRLSIAMLDAVGVLERYVHLVAAGRYAAARALDSDPHARLVAQRLVAAKSSFDQSERALAITRFDQLRRQLRYYAAGVIGVAIAGIAVTLFTTARFGLRLAQRLLRLAQNARQLGEGEDPLPIGGGDEVADLDRVYREMARNLRREHRVASTLQQALLPQQTPELDGIEISTVYLPATEGAAIGGDWYDAFALEGSLLALSVGDVAGSGLSAATIMGSVRQAIRTAARESIDPAAVLAMVNRMVCAEGWLVTAFFAVLDASSGDLTYASAGHPPPLVAAGRGPAAVLECDGLILGVDSQALFEARKGILDADSLLVLYTDGLIEVRRDVLSGLEQLRGIVDEKGVRTALFPARAIQSRVFERVSPHDDSAILTVRLTRVPGPPANGEPHANWTFDARDAHAAGRVRKEMVEFITGHAPESDFSTAELVFSELAGNVAKHTPGPASFSVERRNGSVVMRISDLGKPFAYQHREEIDMFAESGRGLFLVHMLSASVHIERSDGRNTVTVLLQA